jgi:hypothetical protein
MENPSHSSPQSYTKCAGQMIKGLRKEHNRPEGYFISVGGLSRNGLYERGMQDFKCGVVYIRVL